MTNSPGELFRNRLAVSYHQVALFDAQTRGAYPQWKTGHETVVVGTHGVAVAVAPDVEVVVQKGTDAPPGFDLCVSAEITVEAEGVIVGNVPSAVTSNLNWPKGKTTVVIYVNGLNGTASQVYFCLAPYEA